MNATYLRYVLVLGLMAAVGPFAIDMYLPALPTIAEDLGTSTAAAQATLMVYFITFGVCQILYGPISDMLGRKKPLYFGFSLFIAGCVGCALAPSIEWLIFFRFVQGAGASAIMSLPRAIVRDLYTGVKATRLMAQIMLVISISPMLAPLAGSAIIVPFGWRFVFVAVTVIGVAGLVMMGFFLPETLPPERRVTLRLSNLLSGFGRLLRDPGFMGLTFVAALGMSSFFVFLASSSFVYMEHFGLTPTQFSLAFAANAVGFFGATQMAARLGERFGMVRMVTTAVTGFAFFTVLQLATVLAGADSLPLLMLLLFAGNACLGLVIPTSMVLALEAHGPIAGMAAALGGTLQMVTGSIMIAITSNVFGTTPMTMVGAIAFCGVGAFIIAQLTMSRVQVLPEAAE
jgi:DHA1 family bicyclomycin/chloramphenicol resistance-like MFS transporter